MLDPTTFLLLSLLFFFGFAVVAGYLLYKNFLYAWIFSFIMMPISMNLPVVFGAAITLPSDLLAILLFVFIIVKAIELYKEYLYILSHPVSKLLLAFILWGFISTIFSEDIIVSLKRMLNYSWYIFAFFGFSLLVFRKNKEYFVYAMKVSVVPIMIVSFYLMLRFALLGFNFNLVKDNLFFPFYKDHTIYGASLGFFLVSYLGLALDKELPKTQRVLFLISWIVVTIAIIISLTRGTWLGLLVSAIFIGLIKLWDKSKLITIFLIIIITSITAFQINNVILHLEHKIQKRYRENVVDRFISMADLERDQSNLERLNRWVSAIRMTIDKPLFGFGPGNYERYYAPYQMSRFITYISTNRGDVGSAHNEILLAASEMGIPGGIIILLLFIISTVYAIKGYFRTDNKRTKLYYLIILGNLLTYYIHGIFNNFMDQDKAAIPLFTSLALLVAYDLYYNKQKTK